MTDRHKHTDENIKTDAQTDRQTVTMTSQSRNCSGNGALRYWLISMSAGPNIILSTTNVGGDLVM